MSITKVTNYALSVVAIVTLLAPVSFCLKTKYPPFTTSKGRQRVLLGTDSFYVVVTPINRLCRADSSWLRLKLGLIFTFYKTAPVAKLFSWQQH